MRRRDLIWELKRMAPAAPLAIILRPPPAADTAHAVAANAAGAWAILGRCSSGATYGTDVAALTGVLRRMCRARGPSRRRRT